MISKCLACDVEFEEHNRNLCDPPVCPRCNFKATVGCLFAIVVFYFGTIWLLLSICQWEK
jgi:hypothetical protein